MIQRIVKRLISLFCILSATMTARTQTADILQVPVLSGENRSSTIPDNAGTLCFDKYMKLVSTDGYERIITTHVYINSRLGYYGFRNEAPDSPTDIRINPEEDGFRFTLISLEGNTYVYLNKRTDRGMKKYVMTHNSGFYHEPDNGFSQYSSLRRISESQNYGHHRSGFINCTGYEAAGGKVKYFIHGNNYPDEITVAPGSRYLGILGTGYFNVGSKVYLSMARWENGKEKTAVRDIRSMENCLNTAGFERLEDVMYNKELVSIQKQRNKLLRDTRIPTTCTMEALALRNFRLSMLDKREILLEKSVLGNTLTSEPAQQAIAGLYNYEDQLRVMILEKEMSICETEADLARSSSNPQLAQKLECNRRQLRQMNSNLEEMRNLKNLYPNDPGKQMQQQSRLLMNVTSCD